MADENPPIFSEAWDKIWQEKDRQRYFGYPEHNRTATNLLKFVFYRNQRELESEVAILALRNDYELPAYLQDGVLDRPQYTPKQYYVINEDYPEDTPKLYMTAFEAAAYTRNIPALVLFKNHLNTLDKLDPLDNRHRIFLLNAHNKIIDVIENFPKNDKSTLDTFTNDVVAAIKSSNLQLIKTKLHGVGIYLQTLIDANSLPRNRPSVVTGPYRFHWMTIPSILDAVKDVRNEKMLQIVQGLQHFYTFAAYAYLATKIPPWKRPSDKLNVVSIGSEWEHYVHHPSSGATFDLEGNQISGEIGQRYHDLRFDAHTGQLFNQDGEEVELVGLGMPKIFKKGASRILDGKSGISENKTYRIYDDGAPEYVTFVTLRGKGLVDFFDGVVRGSSEKGSFFNRGKTKAYFPVFLMTNKSGKTYVVAYTQKLGGNRVKLLPNTFAPGVNSVFVKKFLYPRKDSFSPAREFNGSKESWTKTLKKFLEEHTAKGIQSEIDSPYSSPVSRPFCETEESFGTYASSSSSSSSSAQISALEQF